MNIGIMQPYILPYIGYFQLIASVDSFVVYDNIQYTKKGWINRNQILIEGRPSIFTIPLRKDSDYLDINMRFLAKTFDRSKLLHKFKAAYAASPFFLPTMDLLEQIISCDEENLFDYIYNSLLIICSYLKINTVILKSSEIDVNHLLRGQDRVISICTAINAKTYINPCGGANLYDKNVFNYHRIGLKFIKMKEFTYSQSIGGSFVPSLSIIDLLMNCSLTEVKQILFCQYKLL